MIRNAQKRRNDFGKKFSSISSVNGEEQLFIEQAQARVEQLELINGELENEIDQNKIKARGLLMQKEMQENRIKLIITKLENHMKNVLNIS